MGNKWIEKLYFGFLLLLPFVFCSSIVDPVLIPRQMLLSGFLFIVVVLLILRKTELKFNFKTPIVYASAGFIFLNFISFFNTNVPGETHTVFSKLVLLFSFFLVTTVLLYNDVIRSNRLVVSVSAFGLIMVAFPILEIIGKSLEGQHLLRQIELIRGSSANKNLLSSALFLCIPFYCIGLQQSVKSKFLSLFALIPTLLVLITIRTRAVLIGLFIFIVLLICYKVKQRFSIQKKYFLISGIAIIALAISTYFFYAKSKADELNKPVTGETQRYVTRLLDSGTFESRILFWKNSIQMWKENPVLGVGLGNWQIEFSKYGLNNFKDYKIVNGQSTLQRPHNDFIWILCETGILGLSAYLLIFGIIFYQLYTLIRQAKTSAEKWKFFFIFSALAGYMVISFFDFPYERIEHQIIIMLFFALVSSAYLKKINARNTYFSRFLFILIIPIAYSFLVTLYRFSGEKHTVKMYNAKLTGNWNETIYESKKANSYFYRLDNSSMPLSWYEGIGHFNENRPEESQECFEKAYQLSPYNIQVITNLASTYQVNGKVDEAIELYNEALKISKDFDEAKLNLAALYFNKKEYDKAYATINEVDVNSKNPKYQTYLITILNQKINAYLKTAIDKNVVDRLVKNVTTKEALLKLFFDAKAKNIDFETYLSQAKF